ncbi:type III PLP-dependent enzyme [Oleisolibacter albus]|uniref:type III PLP-dependent enzyme n=1 Tax=Oleisolibacter albus TaxID=2171757 RepID=UPI000DF41DBA|nr:type III PLP-dependent enzyme [Oleisolibacter albus]
MTEKIARFFREQSPATPCLVIDLDVVADNYAKLAGALPDSKIFYAVKANPAPEILRLLVSLGSSFDTASVPEIQDCLAAGATPDRISFGNTIKKASDIARAHALGVRLYAFDSIEELEKIAEHAPGSRVFCRILTSGEGADWPLSRKFGCEPEMARDLLLKAAGMNVVPYGISFHVGSQQRDVGQWDLALATTAAIFRDLEEKGVVLRMVNMGGGFPTRYLRDVPTSQQYGEAIDAALRTHFGNRIPETIIEPGRGMVGNAGIIQSEVVLISRKSANDDKRWVYLDIGKFGGLAETMDESIRYPIVTERDGDGESAPVILAGPTCDSADVLYEKSPYSLPTSLKIGDRVSILATGAYTTTYSAVNFNGFAPLSAYYI